MSRVFAYCRVSTSGQTTDNQVRDIIGAGFAIEPHRVIEEMVSGSSSVDSLTKPDEQCDTAPVWKAMGPAALDPSLRTSL
jgi:hypothetical protein